MVEITESVISPEQIVSRVKSRGSGCVVTYVGLIRDNSQNKAVLSVEYNDPDGKAKGQLQEIVSAISQKWPVNDVAIVHRIGELTVGEINLVVAIASAHRKEGFLACQYAIDQFKEKLPTAKKETYQDGTS